jgi:hypothetical protein
MKIDGLNIIEGSNIINLVITNKTHAEKNALTHCDVGEIIYQTNAVGDSDSGLYYYTGTKWELVKGGGIPAKSYNDRITMIGMAAGALVFQTNNVGASNTGIYFFDGALWHDINSVSANTGTTLPNKAIPYSKDGKIAADIAKLSFDDNLNVLTTKRLELSGDATANQALLKLTNTGSDIATGGNLHLLTSKNSGSGIANTTQIGGMVFGGWDGVTNALAASVASYTTESWQTGKNGSNLVFSSTKNGTAAATPALIIDEDRTIIITQCIQELISEVTGNVLNVDLSLGSIQKLTTGGVTMTNGIGYVAINLPPVSTLMGKSFTVIVKYTGVHGITWSTGIRWADNLEPTPTAIADRYDVFTFFSDGAVIFGSCAQNF